MDRVDRFPKLITLLKEYKYIVLIFAAGILLMLMPTQKDTPKQNSAISEAETESSDTGLEESLGSILSELNGAGKVTVLLTQAQGPRYIYQTDGEGLADSSKRSSTVIIQSSDRNQEGLIQQVLPETYRGAIILCQGADSAVVRLAIIEAVANVTGLSSDKISVLKMK